MGKLNWLSQNGKMKKIETADVYNWGIPAFMSKNGTRTCPMAGVCASGCYAQSGSYRYSNVASKYESRLELALSPQFETVIGQEIQYVKARASKRGKPCIIRIHDSGDFFSKEYTEKWLNIIQSHSDIVFYAYTKQVSQFKALDLPPNLIMIYSYGGREDHLIDPERDRHSAVFQDEKSLNEAGYANASQDDMVAIGSCLKIGLVFHHSKNYANTKWDKAKVS
jgi:Gene product 88